MKWTIEYTDPAVMREAAESTLKDASLALAICCFGFDKSSLKASSVCLDWPAYFIRNPKKARVWNLGIVCHTS